MAVRTVDTLKPNNSTTATGKGTFPVAKADDVWFNDGDSLEEKVQNGTIGASIQVVAMPTANIENFGKIVQYIGITDTDYTNGHFYKCVTTDDGQGGLIYEWIHQNVDEISGNDTIQVQTLPTASASEVGNIYQYIGATTTTLTNGHFYECIEDSGSYSWVEKEVQKNEDVPHWSGTRAEYEAIKDTLEAGTYIGITDDYDDGLEVVDVIEDGNMNPVTSNAVAGLLDTVDIIPVTTNNNFVRQEVNCKKAGRIIILNFRGCMNNVALSTDANNETPLGSIPAAYAPKSIVSNMIQGWDGILRKTALSVDTSGNIWSYGEVSTNNQYMWGQVSWVFED